MRLLLIAIARASVSTGREWTLLCSLAATALIIIPVEISRRQTKERRRALLTIAAHHVGAAAIISDDELINDGRSSKRSE